MRPWPAFLEGEKKQEGGAEPLGVLIVKPKHNAHHAAASSPKARPRRTKEEEIAPSNSEEPVQGPCGGGAERLGDLIQY